MNENRPIPVEERVRRGQSGAFGETADGQTDVCPETQGISNRRGDRPNDTARGIEDDVLAFGGSDDGVTGDVPAGEDELAAEDDEDDEDEDDAEDEDEVNDPDAEPGKPI